MRLLKEIISAPFLLLIMLYQKTISPDHGFFKQGNPHGYCRFHPTCSEYTYESIHKFGPLLGGIMGTWRIMRCNPWNKGGNDPVPEHFIEAFKARK